MDGNSTNNSIYWDLYKIQYMYIGFAALAIFANSIILIVLLRNLAYLKKSAFLAGLAVGDMTLGIGVLVAGTLRIFIYKKIVFTQGSNRFTA